MAPAWLARGASLALISALAATGCFSDRGVAIEVDVGATGATSVELFLGEAACDKGNAAGIACTTIAPPPDGSVALDGSIWFRDALAPYVADVHGGTATFQLRADTATTLPIVIAIGSVADPSAAGKHPVATATIHDLAIPLDGARVVMTALAPAAPLALPEDDTHGVTEDRVAVWQKQSPPSTCVVVEHWNQGQPQRDFVVPAEDPDCDDVPAPECNPAAYLGSNTVGGARDRPTCFTSKGGPACVLGELRCQDTTTGGDHSCFPLDAPTCVPDALCGACAVDDDACWRTLLTPLANPVARIECRVPFRVTLGKFDLCPMKSQAAIDLDAFFPSGKCPQPELGALPGTDFDTSHAFDGATMVLSSPASNTPCEFAIRWTDSARPMVDPTDEFGIIQFKASSAGADSLFLPIAFRFVQDCLTTAFECDYAPGAAPTDSLWTCAP